MKNKKLAIIVFIIIAALIMTFTACSGSSNSSSVNITAAQMSTDADENRLPIDNVKTFAPNIKEIYFTGTVENVPDNKIIYCVLKYDGTQIQKSANLDASNHTKANFYFKFTKGSENWEEGKYTAEVYVVGEEKPAKTVKFKVSNKKADIFITDVCLTSGLSGGMAVDSLTDFSISSPIIIVWGIERNAPEHTQIKILVKFEGSLVSTDFIDNETVANNYFNLKATSSKPWVTGNYSVEVYVNEDKTPVKTINFTISE